MRLQSLHTSDLVLDTCWRAKVGEACQVRRLHGRASPYPCFRGSRASGGPALRQRQRCRRPDQRPAAPAGTHRLRHRHTAQATHACTHAAVTSQHTISASARLLTRPGGACMCGMSALRAHMPRTTRTRRRRQQWWQFASRVHTDSCTACCGQKNQQDKGCGTGEAMQMQACWC